MMNKVLFKEEQQFRQWWQIVVVLGTAVLAVTSFVYTLYQQNVKGIQVGNSPAPNWVMIVALIVVCVSVWSFFAMKLEVRITRDGIYYRFFPVIIREKYISREEILRFEIRKYRAKLEYGGRGVRYGFMHKWGKGYSVSGNIGLQLYLNGGKKILFGTQRSQAIVYAMDEMMKR